MHSQRIIFRCNGNARIGYGHVVRSAALAGMLAEDFSIVFCCAAPDDFVRSQLPAGAKLIELPQAEEFLPDDPEASRELPYDLDGIINAEDIVVLDGYRFKTGYRKSVKHDCKSLVIIDDLPEGEYPADLVINASPYLPDQAYPGAVQWDKISLFPKTMLLCQGLEYALLRKPFYAPSENKAREGIVIIMGGADPFGLTGFFADELLSNTSFFIHAVITGAYPPAMVAGLKERSRGSGGRLKIHSGLDAEAMKNLLDTVRYGIFPSSGTLIEALKRGVQPVYGYYADNQLNYYNYFRHSGAGFPIGDLRLKESLFMDSLQTHNYHPEVLNELQWKIGSGDFKNVFHEIAGR